MPTTADINYIEDKNGDVFFPVTHVGAVIDDDNNALNSILDDKVSSSSYDNIVSISKTDFDALATKDGRTMYIVDDPNGEISQPISIQSVTQTTESTVSGGTNVITVTKTDGTTSTFNVRNGDAVGAVVVAQTMGTSTTSTMSQNAISEELNNIGRYSYGSFDCWNYNNEMMYARSKYTYDVNNGPVIDLISYNAQSSLSSSPSILVITPSETYNRYASPSNSIELRRGIWGLELYIKRNGTELYNQAIFTSDGEVKGIRIDFRNNILMWGYKSSGTVTTGSVDLSSYDLAMGDCYIFTGFGTNGYVANCFVGINAGVAESFKDYLTRVPAIGAFKMFSELGTVGSDTDNLNNSGNKFVSGCGNGLTNPTQVSDGHFQGTIDTDNMTTVKLSADDTGMGSTQADRVGLLCYFFIAPTNGDLNIKSDYYHDIVGVADTTAKTYIFPVDGVYTLTSGHVYWVSCPSHINWNAGGIGMAGHCTVDIYGFEHYYRMASNLTPINYDGITIRGDAPFTFEHPEYVVSAPIFYRYEYRTYQLAGQMRYQNNGRVYLACDNGDGTITEKQINNS